MYGTQSANGHMTHLSLFWSLALYAILDTSPGPHLPPKKLSQADGIRSNLSFLFWGDQGGDNNEKPSLQTGNFFKWSTLDTGYFQT